MDRSALFAPDPCEPKHDGNDNPGSVEEGVAQVGGPSLSTGAPGQDGSRLVEDGEGQGAPIPPGDPVVTEALEALEQLDAHLASLRQEREKGEPGALLAQCPDLANEPPEILTPRYAAADECYRNLDRGRQWLRDQLSSDLAEEGEVQALVAKAKDVLQRLLEPTPSRATIAGHLDAVKA